MIVKVRLAPMERWCAPMKEAAKRIPVGLLPPVGYEVEIETSSMRTTQKILFCNGREWFLTSSDPKMTLYDARTGELTMQQGGWICEHMLEMD